MHFGGQFQIISKKEKTGKSWGSLNRQPRQIHDSNTETYIPESQDKITSSLHKKYERRFYEIIRKCEMVARNLENSAPNGQITQKTNPNSTVKFVRKCGHAAMHTNNPDPDKNTYTNNILIENVPDVSNILQNDQKRKSSPEISKNTSTSANKTEIKKDGNSDQNNVNKSAPLQEKPLNTSEGSAKNDKNSQNKNQQQKKNEINLPKVFLKNQLNIFVNDDRSLSKDTRSTFSEEIKTDNASLQKVTQDLTHIIKNFQQQIHNVQFLKEPVVEIPSAMIQPKKKKYFMGDVNKKPETSPNKNNKNDNISNNNIKINNKQHTSNLKRSSSSRNSNSSSQKFKSSTESTLSTSSSLSSKRVRRRASFITNDLIKQLKNEVQQAIRKHKTFTIRGNFPVIRKALLQRGWVEKLHRSYTEHSSEQMKSYFKCTISELLMLLKHENIPICENMIKSKLLGGHQVDFYWGIRASEAFKENPDKIKLTKINKLKTNIFSYTNKQGLCDASKISYWYQQDNVSKLNHPRTYSLSQREDIRSFIEDFQITAAMSLLKWIVKINITKECKLMSPSGKIPIEVFDFALNECCKFVKKRRHEDIDTKIPEASKYEWGQFLEYFYKIIHNSGHFKKQGKENEEESMVAKSNYLLNSLKDIWPFLEMDGFMNIWILKPANSCQGRGIHMCRTLSFVLNIITRNNTRYIIQKYIERPLLIENTKFDIRQWFLISNCSPLTIWIYKECYLRFSCQTYNLRKLHESIHITNNHVQRKYKNNVVAADRDLPSYNMWDSYEFQKYLANIGYPNAFQNIIYPGMKQCITAAILMHQDKITIRRNCYELHGADFMLTEDFKPWLLEINSNPALSSSTPVTARMCPKVLEDVIKETHFYDQKFTVVIDYAHDNKASTGEFELLYKEQISKLPSPVTFELKGKPLRKHYFYTPKNEMALAIQKPKYNPPLLLEEKQANLKMCSEEIKKTLKNVLEIIHHEKQRRKLKNKNVGCESLLNLKD